MCTTQSGPPQRDDVRKIQVIPFHPAIVWLLRADALKARIEAAPDMNHNRIWVAPQEILGKAVEFAGFQDHNDPAGIFGQGRRLPQVPLIQLANQRLGSLVFDKGIGAL
jgi:hypothetical protein